MFTIDRPRSGISLNIDGQAVPVEDVTWVVYGSCGCAFGMTTADQYDGTYLLTPEQAARGFHESLVHLKRAQDDGVTLKALPRQEASMGAKCEHTPPYGTPDATPTVGYEWATTDKWWTGRQTHLRHIVPTNRPSEFRDTPSAALCGKTPSSARGWHTDQTDRGTHIKSKVPCRKCLAANAKTQGFLDAGLTENA